MKKNYSWLLFDADNTLLDFSQACRDAFWQSFQDFKIKCSDEIFEVYEEINKEVWKRFEKGEIDSVTLRSLRFSLLFQEIRIGHINAFLFNKSFLENLVHVSELYNGVKELLTSLKTEHKISIVTNGLKEVQRPRLSRLAITDFFDSIIVSDEIGVAKPDERYFEHVMKTIPTPPSKDQILMIGDNLHSDIIGGKNFGLDTCWITHGRENNTGIDPTFSIEKVHDIVDYL